MARPLQDVSSKMKELNQIVALYYHDHIIPWRSFLDTYQFSVPEPKGAELLTRVKVNLTHYHCNYICICVAILTVFMVFGGWGFLLSSVISVSGFTYIISLLQNRSGSNTSKNIALLPLSTSVDPWMVIFAWTVFSVLMIWVMGGWNVLSCLIMTCGMVVLIHSIFRMEVESPTHNTTGKIQRMEEGSS